MGFSSSDVVPFTQARANLSELADQAKAGAEKIITKNGESYVALIDADRLDYYHQLERERIHLLLIEDAKRGLADIMAGRTLAADGAISQLQQRRARRIDHRRLGSPDELRVGVHRVLPAKLLHGRRLGLDVPCDAVGRVEFVQLG